MFLPYLEEPRIIQQWFNNLIKQARKPKWLTSAAEPSFIVGMGIGGKEALCDSKTIICGPGMIPKKEIYDYLQQGGKQLLDSNCLGIVSFPIYKVSFKNAF